MRPTTHEYFLRMARLVGTRSTCYRRQVGCVLVDSYKRVIATGYNGVPSGTKHCNHINSNGLNPYLCSGALSMSGTNLTSCRAIHAEINALISCRHPEDIVRAYCTASPCNLCIGPLLNTPCQEIIFEEEYPHPQARDEWVGAGRKWTHHKPVGRSGESKEGE